LSSVGNCALSVIKDLSVPRRTEDFFFLFKIVVLQSDAFRALRPTRQLRALWLILGACVLAHLLLPWHCASQNASIWRETAIT
ncbi:unnamed protein product, partial [Amoebophrya sp. A25]